MIYFLVLRNSWREFGTEKVSEPVSERIWYRKVPKLVSEKIWYQNSPGTGLGENLVLKKSWNWSWRKLGTEKSPRTGLGQIFGSRHTLPFINMFRELISDESTDLTLIQNNAAGKLCQMFALS